MEALDFKLRDLDARERKHFALLTEMVRHISDEIAMVRADLRANHAVDEQQNRQLSGRDKATLAGIVALAPFAVEFAKLAVATWVR